MARPYRTFGEREALLALGLAGLGFISMEATLPAAGVLGVRAIRTKRSTDRGEPVLGVLVLGVAWLSFMLGWPTLRAVFITAMSAEDDWRLIGFVAGWLALAAGVMALANFLLRTHPERWVARAAARAAIVAVAAAGLLQTITVTGDKRAVSATCGASNADCLGQTPWSSLMPALLIGAVWFGVSLLLPLMADVARTWRPDRLRRPRPWTGS